MSLYAPKWSRETASAANGSTSPAHRKSAESIDSPSYAAPDTADEGLVIDGVRVPRSLDPTALPDQQAAPRSRLAMSASARLGLAIGAAGLIALIVAGSKLPSIWASGTHNGGDEYSSAFQPRFHGEKPAYAARPSPPAPKLVAERTAPRGAGEPLPLGVSAQNPGEGGVLIVGGLASGTTLSAGRPKGANEWQLATGDLSNVMIRPPGDFAGVMDLTLELRTADDVVGDRGSLHLEWRPPPVREVPPQEDASHRPDPDEIVALLKRSDALIASGDLAAARLVLRRAAAAGDARAALALAGTYDPMVLAKLGVHGFAPDVAMARAWYEKAAKLGSAEAPQRLKMLASRQQ